MGYVSAKRIIDITDRPQIQDSDYFVIDGESGTRKVPASNILVKFGTTYPSSDLGVPGMLYLQMNGGVVEYGYCKVDDTTWLQIIPGSYTPTSNKLHEMTWEEVGTYSWGQISNFTW